MSQPVFDDDLEALEVQAPAQADPLLSSLLIFTAIFLIGASVAVLYKLGHTYAAGPLKPLPVGGTVSDVSSDSKFIHFSAKPEEGLAIGDVVFILRRDESTNKDVVIGRAEVVRSKFGGEDPNTLNMLKDHWGFDPAQDFVGRMLPEYSMVAAGNPDQFVVQREDRVSSALQSP